ncbi:hypothetical protein [Neorhodopirellula pilleata]|uniref:Uncharacterized protein n=1 Tax=Neorhodopirellula pilleata TaxID=2714738 RepID=A0A5C6A7Q2_9BACT|nr:hypothetical protein [Neorhodopirellula pilleata]TWT95549.1 hypothetical protein Pla100_31900 [Neorhodopirellula pilleata]
MAKYYVQSGNFRRVVSADNSRKAAIWAVHEVMQQILPSDETESSSASMRLVGEHEPRSVTVLSAKVRVNERGFDRDDAREMSTMEIVAEWNQMVMTLDRLQRMFGSVTDAEASVVKPSETRFFGDGMAA